MQTFIPYTNIKKSAKVLDNKRLGKQRVEAIQIARCLLGYTEGWCHHTVTKMWKYHESFLINIYLKTIMSEWENRGMKNDKCKIHYEYLSKVLQSYKPIKPWWMNDRRYFLRFCRRHKSNLIRKYPEYYRDKFPGIPDNLPYLWPTNE